jgi:hypothetical protein
MILLSYASDRVGNRGHFVNFGFVMMIAGFGIYLGVPATSHAARFAALILAETGHYSEWTCLHTLVGPNANDCSFDSSYLCLDSIELRKRIQAGRRSRIHEQFLTGHRVSPRSRWCD